MRVEERGDGGDDPRLHLALLRSQEVQRRWRERRQPLTLTMVNVSGRSLRCWAVGQGADLNLRYDRLRAINWSRGFRGFGAALGVSGLDGLRAMRSYMGVYRTI